MWTEEARQAAAAARAAKAGAKQQQPGRKRGPQTQHSNLGNRAAFALRNKMQHDAGRADRMAAAHQAGVMQIGRNVLRAGAGMMAGIATTVLKTGQRGHGGGMGRR